MSDNYLYSLEWQVNKDAVAIFWNLMGLFAQMTEEIPKNPERVMRVPPHTTRWQVAVPCKINASYRQSMDDLLEVETDVVYQKRLSWQWHDSLGVWRILEVSWAYSEKAKTLVYSDPWELPFPNWPLEQYYKKLDLDRRFYNGYGRFREDVDRWIIERLRLP